MAPRKARPDAEGTAKPLTRLVAHVGPNDCIGPGITRPEALEDVETGERTPLAPLTLIPQMFPIQDTDSLGRRFIAYTRELEMLASEVEDHLAVLAEVTPTVRPDEAFKLKYVSDQLTKRLRRILHLSKG